MALVVRDYDEAIEFYTKTLHFTLVEDTYQPEQDKRWFLHDAGTHGFMPMEVVARESLAWLDRYLGPVRLVP